MLFLEPYSVRITHETKAKIGVAYECPHCFTPGHITLSKSFESQIEPCKICGTEYKLNTAEYAAHAKANK